MAAREMLMLDEPAAPAAAPPNLVMRGSCNWTAVGFFGALGLLHLSIWLIALLHGHVEGYMSLMFGIAFVCASIASWLITCEIAILAGERRVRLRTGYRRCCFERFVPFERVRGIRLTLTREPDHATGRVELVCDDEAIECPPTPVARQEALCLAVTLGVRLIKVSDGHEGAGSQRRGDEYSMN
jgi:hypothetical protein